MKPRGKWRFSSVVVQLVAVFGILIQTADTVALQPSEHRERADFEPALSANEGQMLLRREKDIGKKRIASSALINHYVDATYNEETPVVFLGWELPITWEGIFAGIFVCMIASVPVFVGYLDKKPSKTQYVQSIGLLLWLVACLYLFTQKVEFKSVHFSGHRPLTLVETIYLMAQVLTTVGHGDITPADEWSQAVVGAYVLFTILLIADMVSAVVHVAIVNTKGYYSHKLESYQKPALGRLDDPMLIKKLGLEEKIESHEEWLRREAPLLPWGQLLAKLGGFTVFVLIGACFYHFYPGENKAWHQGLYMSVITLSTVGLGAELPATEAGKVFGAFWMLFGVVSLLNLVGGFTELMLAAKARDQWDNEAEHAELNKLRSKATRLSDGTLVISKYDFLVFGALHAKLMQWRDLEKIEQTFQALGPDSNGNIRLDCIERATMAHALHY